MESGGLRNSSLLLVLANLIPFAGVLLWNWDLSTLLVLYWAETAVIGMYHLIRLLIGGHWFGLAFAPIFLLQYGAFMFVHAIFIAAFFFPQGAGIGVSDFDIFISKLAFAQPALLALFISHGFSFIYNGVYLGEYKSVTLRKLDEVVKKPFQRIIIMHFTIIFGGMLVGLLGEPVLGLVALITIKSMVDVRAHVKFHSGTGQIKKKKDEQREQVNRGPQYVQYTKKQALGK